MSWIYKNHQHATVILLILLISCWPNGAGAEAVPCPACGDGCVAEGLVKTVRQDRVQIQKMCPEGCLPIEHVQELLAQAKCTYSDPKHVDPTGPEQRRIESSRNRMTIMPTALGAPAGQFSATGQMGAFWHLEYAVNDYLQVGATVVLPIMVAGVLPTIKTQVRVHDNLALGAGAFFGVGGAYISDNMDVAFTAGIHGTASMVFGDHCLNLGVVGLGHGLKGEGEKFELHEDRIMTPNLGYLWAFHSDWSFQTELISFLNFRKGDDGPLDTIFLFTYGFRGHGDHIFGELGFALPFFEGFVTGLWRYAPLGFPYFSIGFKN